MANAIAVPSNVDRLMFIETPTPVVLSRDQLRANIVPIKSKMPSRFDTNFSFSSIFVVFQKVTQSRPSL